MDLPSFQHIAPALRLYSGANSLVQLGRELERLGAQRAVAVCGGSLLREGKALEQLRGALGARLAGVVAGVKAHSPVPAVEEVARELERLEADAVIAVGGGSAIVTARAASILLAEKGAARDLCTTREPSGKLRSPKLLAPKLPQLVLPTTPTTAMVKAGSAVFDPVEKKRLALFDPKTRAQAVFVHPDFIATAPSGLLVSASLNTLVLALEGLLSTTGDPLADALLMHAIRLVNTHLTNRTAHDDPRVRGDLVLAAVLCGQGTDFTGAGVVTVLSHATGARHGLENGVLNAVFLPLGLRFNAAAAPAGMDKVATALDTRGSDGHADVERMIAHLRGLFDQLGVPRRLRDMGVPQSDLEAIATLGMGDWFLLGNPRPVREQGELQALLEQAW